MNVTAAFWWDLFARLLFGSSALLILALAVNARVRLQQQRKVWQATIAALLLLFVAEGTALHRQMEFVPEGSKPPSQSRQLVAQVLPASEISAPSSMPPQSRSEFSSSNWLPGIIWLTIFGCIVTRNFASRLVFIAFVHRRRHLIATILQEKVDALARQMNIRGRIYLSESELLAGPIAFGFLRRCICVPKNFCQTFNAREQEVMLAHELAHLAARDPLWYAAADLAVAVFWFNPLFWFGRKQFQAACEGAADEASLLIPDGPSTLAECLVQFGKRLAAVKSYGWIGAEGSRFRSGLGRRVNRLLSCKEGGWQPLSRWRTALTYSAAIVIAGALLVSSAAYGNVRSQSLAKHLWVLAAAQLAEPPRHNPVQNVAQAPDTPPPQLMIEAKFVEFSDPLDVLELRNLVIGGENWATNAFWGILPPSKYRDLIKRLERRQGVDVLAAPKVTTLSGRRAQIKIVEVRYIVTDLDPSPGPTNPPLSVAEGFELGPTLDVAPVARADGLSIDLTLISSIREFVGYKLKAPSYYDSPTRPLTPAPLREYARENSESPVNPFRPSPVRQPVPEPIFRMRQANVSGSVWDGQTVVIHLPLQKPLSANPNMTYTSSGKTCFVFVTPVLIDPAGNRLNDENTLPYIEQTIPR